MRFMATALVGVCAACVGAPSQAASVSYQLSQVSGSTWQYVYTVTNDGTGSIALFDILFDPAEYDETSLTAVSGPEITAGWDEKFLASGIGIPAAYDVLATGAGVAPGASVGGFTVRVHWLGAGTPGAQDFEIYSPQTFELLGSGTTAPVPAPAGALLALSAFATLVARLRRRR